MNKFQMKLTKRHSERRRESLSSLSRESMREEKDFILKNSLKFEHSDDYNNKLMMNSNHKLLNDNFNRKINVKNKPRNTRYFNSSMKIHDKQSK